MAKIYNSQFGGNCIGRVDDSKIYNSKFSFAGRLDPMAHGKMILLKDEECKDQPKYCGLKKTYIFLLETPQLFQPIICSILSKRIPMFQLLEMVEMKFFSVMKLLKVII